MVGTGGFSFFRATPELRELTLLQGISRDSTVTQGKLAKAAGIAPSMVNVYLREFAERGLMQKSNGNRRNMTYHLTPLGESRRQQLSRMFINETVGLYKRSKEQFEEQVLGLKKSGIERVVLYGAGETGELVSTVAESAGLVVVGIVDGDPKKQGRTFCGRQVVDPGRIPELQPQAVIVTSLGHGDEIAASLEPIERSGTLIVRLRV